MDKVNIATEINREDFNISKEEHISSFAYENDLLQESSKFGINY